MLSFLIEGFESLFQSVKEELKHNEVPAALPALQGRFFLQVIGAVAEFEHELIRERIKDKLKVLKFQEKHLGRPFGAKDKKQRQKSSYWLRYTSKR